MFFRHSPEIWTAFPELVPGVIAGHGIQPEASVEPAIARFREIAASRLARGAEGEFAEIRAWRQAFSKMGLKPTRHRCASEALLRRFRQDASLPRIHPLVDLCNAASMAFAIPIAVFDTGRIAGGLEVRLANGGEPFVTFAGGDERPEPGEIIFADMAGIAHSRRWTNRQSGLSAVGDLTSSVLIVAEGLHDSAAADVRSLLDQLTEQLDHAWSVVPASAVLDRRSPQFLF